MDIHDYVVTNGKRPRIGGMEYAILNNTETWFVNFTCHAQCYLEWTEHPSFSKSLCVATGCQCCTSCTEIYDEAEVLLNSCFPPKLAHKNMQLLYSSVDRLMWQPPYESSLVEVPPAHSTAPASCLLIVFFRPFLKSSSLASDPAGLECGIGDQHALQHLTDIISLFSAQ